MNQSNTQTILCQILQLSPALNTVKPAINKQKNCLPIGANEKPPDIMGIPYGGRGGKDIFDSL